MRSTGIAQLWHDLAGALPRPPLPGRRTVRAFAGVRSLATAARLRPMQPGAAVAAAVAGVAAVGCLRFAAPADMRLAVLYLVPIALAAWSAGRAAGFLVAVFAIATAALANVGRDVPVDLVFAGNLAVLLGTLLLFVEMLTRVRGELVRSDQRLLWILDGLADALYVTDEAGTVLYANRRFTTLLGAAEPRTERDVAARLLPVRGASELQDRRGYGCEVRDAQDGRRYRLRSSAIPWVDGTHVELHVLTDLTAQRIEQGLHDAERAAVRHAARVSDMGETASILAHELNQPLVALVGYNTACLRLLDSATLDRETLAQALEKSRAQAVRAGEIVNRLRELARRRAPRLASADVNAVVRQQLASTAGEIAAAGADLEVALAPDLAPVECDSVLVGQVVRNLVANAIDAMWDRPHGARHLQVATEPLPARGVHISVSDRGHGVAPDIADRMYRPFFTTRNTGLGLGLAICRSIAEAHGGRLWHESRAGGGTAFHFTLP